MPRPVAQDHDQKARAIRKAAARLFAEEGYGRASMAQVASRAGISKANIYHYYDGKEALLFDILDTHLRALRDRVCGVSFASDAPEAQLETILTELLAAYEGADAEHAVQLNAIAALPADKRDVLRSYQRDLVAFVRNRIAVLAPDADRATLRSLTMSIFALANWHYQWDGKADLKARAAYAALMTRTFVHGLGG